MYTKYLLFVALIISISFAACKQDKTGGAQQSSALPTADITHLTGHWIAMDFVSRANQYGSVLGAMNNAHAPYAFTVTFDPAFGVTSSVRTGAPDGRRSGPGPFASVSTRRASA